MDGFELSFSFLCSAKILYLLQQLLLPAWLSLAQRVFHFHPQGTLDSYHDSRGPWAQITCRV